MSKQGPPPLRHPGGRFSGQVEKPKNQKETLLRIWGYLKRQRLGMVCAVLFVIASTLLSLFGPLLIGIILDDYIIKLDVSGAIQMSMLLAGIYTGTALLTWFQTFVMIHVSQKTIRTLRQELFEKLQSMPLSFFDKRQQGDLMSRMTNDIENLNTALSQSVTQIVSSVLMIMGTVFALFYLNWILALVTLGMLPLIIWTSKQIIVRSSVNYKERQRDLGMLNGYMAVSYTHLTLPTSDLV